MNYILFDDQRRIHFLPLTYTNTIADLLMGFFTNRRRWEIRLSAKTSSLSVSSLEGKFPLVKGEDNVLINSRLLPNKEVVKEILNLEEGVKLISDTDVLACRMSSSQLEEIVKKSREKDKDVVQALTKTDFRPQKSNYHHQMIGNLWDFFRMNGEMMENDLKILDTEDFKQRGDKSSTLLGDRIYIHKNARVTASILNSTNGPIVIDDGAEVMEGCVVRGGLYLGKNASLKMGAKIYGPTSIGEYSKVGGEVNNSVVNSYSNKGHDGFLGNSVLGQWCNLGADTNNSNLKNDYSEVKLWNYEKESFQRSGLQFLGLIMGDHSKCGINTMFNTGTVVGVCCNLYGAGFQPNFIPSFSWGKPSSYTTYQFNKAMQVAENVMERRKVELSEGEKKLLKSVFDSSEYLRQKFH